jgi:signal transduction histidine kinase
VRARPETRAAALSTMNEITSRLRDARTTAAAVRIVAESLKGVINLRALAIASIGRRVSSWVEPDDSLSLANLHALALGAFAFVRGSIPRTAFQEDKRRASENNGACWTLFPITHDGFAVGVLVAATAEPMDEGELAFASFAANALAEARSPGLARACAVAAGRKRTGERVDLSRAQRARAEAEAHANTMALLSELTATLFSSLEYTSTVRQLTRAVARRAAACVVDIVEASGLRRIAHAPSYPPGLLEHVLDPLVAEVVASGHLLTADRVDADGTPTTAARARAQLGAEWVYSVPLRAGDECLGALTIIGADWHKPPAINFVAQLGERVATAIENGRVYRKAIAQVKNRDSALATLSHDLKNPLGAILMNASFVLKKTPETERREAGRPQIEAIMRSATRMKGLVTDLLDLAALDDGATPMKPQACAARPLFHEVCHTMATAAHTGKVALVDELGDLPNAWMDPARLVQVFLNIVGNGLKFTPPGGSIVARGRVENGEIVISVSDTGSGIGETELAFVFHRFWRAPAATKSGSGLGLAICKTIIELSGGRIWADSEVGVGTTITFTLPIA